MQQYDLWNHTQPLELLYKEIPSNLPGASVDEVFRITAERDELIWTTINKIVETLKDKKGSVTTIVVEKAKLGAHVTELTNRLRNRGYVVLEHSDRIEISWPTAPHKDSHLHITLTASRDEAIKAIDRIRREGVRRDRESGNGASTSMSLQSLPAVQEIRSIVQSCLSRDNYDGIYVAPPPITGSYDESSQVQVFIEFGNREVVEKRQSISALEKALIERFGKRVGVLDGPPTPLDIKYVRRLISLE